MPTLMGRNVLMGRDVLYRQRGDVRDYPTGYHQEDLRLAGVLARPWGMGFGNGPVARARADISSAEVETDLRGLGYVPYSAPVVTYMYATRAEAIRAGVNKALDMNRLRGIYQVPVAQWSQLLKDALTFAGDAWILTK